MPPARVSPSPSVGGADRQRAAHLAAIERLAGGLAGSGFPRLPGRVFSALMLTDTGRLTAAQLAEELQASRAAISGAVRYLEHLGLLRRERERGGRCDVYVIDDDAWHGVLLQADQVYEPVLGALGAALAVVAPQSRAAARLALSHDFLRFIQSEMVQLADRWEAHKLTLPGRAAADTTPPVDSPTP